MAGYYRDPELTASLYTSDGFMRTGDQATIDKEGYISIIGRVKDPFKTAKGEYVNPLPIEHQFIQNPIIGQCCLVGSGLNHTLLIVTLSPESKKLDRSTIEKSLTATLEAINPTLSSFERVGHLYIVKSEWTIENNLLPPTQKIKRQAIEAQYQSQFATIDSNEPVIIWEL